MKSSDIVRMANQIAAYFGTYPKQEALDGIAMHIHNFWEPRMRDDLKAYLDQGGEGLSPLFVESISSYFKGPRPKGPKVKPDPTEKAPKGAQISFAAGGGDAG
jgi:formate dehydrogenase subunit delta